MTTKANVELSYTTTLSVLTCGECSVPFAIPSNMHQRVKADGSQFFCPNGHMIRYSETENKRLQRQLANSRECLDWTQGQLTHERDQRQAAERSASAYKGRVTRLKNRAAAGVCPCCSRHFENVERHMNTKHPGFRESAEPVG